MPDKEKNKEKPHRVTITRRGDKKPQKKETAEVKNNDAADEK